MHRGASETTLRRQHINHPTIFEVPREALTYLRCAADGIRRPRDWRPSEDKKQFTHHFKRQSSALDLNQDSTDIISPYRGTNSQETTLIYDSTALRLHHIPSTEQLYHPPKQALH